MGYGSKYRAGTIGAHEGDEEVCSETARFVRWVAFTPLALLIQFARRARNWEVGGIIRWKYGYVDKLSDMGTRDKDSFAQLCQCDGLKKTHIAGW